MKTINYITNLNVDQFSGGWSAMNHHIYLQLKKYFDINLIQNVDPSYSFIQKVQSKVFRSINLRGSFPAFTNKRLAKIGKMVNAECRPADLNFFHGCTPWVAIQSSIPYAVYLDAPFASYIDIYHKRSSYNKKQINRIIQRETRFLGKAMAVFFSSQWALNETKVQYGLAGDNFYVVGLGGGFDLILPNQSNDTKRYFLFVSHDFYGKGGEIVLKAFSELLKDYPALSLKIVGHKPPVKFLDYPGVEYLGLFDKTKKDEAARLLEVFQKAWCVLLPTSKDITPLVLIEAGIASCPAIAANSFGIPEIVKDKQTGILIDKDKMEKQLYDSMSLLCSDHLLRDQLGERAREHMMENYTWDNTGERVFQILSASN